MYRTMQGITLMELMIVVVIVGISGKTELASAVTAGAFVHRIFSWLVPILVGLIPLAGWRRNMVKAKEAESTSRGDTLSE